MLWQKARHIFPPIEPWLEPCRDKGWAFCETVQALDFLSRTGNPKQILATGFTDLERWEDNLRRAILPSLQGWADPCIPGRGSLFWLGQDSDEGSWVISTAGFVDSSAALGIISGTWARGLVILKHRRLHVPSIKWSSWACTGRWLIWAHGYSSLPWEFWQGYKAFGFFVVDGTVFHCHTRYPGLI